MSKSTDRILADVAQGLRQAHCARRDSSGHKPADCVGVCTITRSSVELDCKLCGNDSQPIAPLDTLPNTRAARRIVEAAGLSWDAISPERKRAAVDAYERELERHGDPAR